MVKYHTVQMPFSIVLMLLYALNVQYLSVISVMIKSWTFFQAT